MPSADPDASPSLGSRHALLRDGRFPVLLRLEKEEGQVLQRPDERVQHAAVAVERPHLDPSGTVSFFSFFQTDLAVRDAKER